MAGYIVKVTLEDTHPPVWRRLVLPDGITFYDLHRVLQAAFEWDDCHLHDFQTSDGNITISLPEARTSGEELPEKSTTVDDFLKSCKWIRYTYDFGDDWRHKIVFEKEDPAYDKRYAAVVKAKGDSFIEDGWDEDGCIERIPFSMEDVNAALERMSFKKKKSSKRQSEAMQVEEDRKMISDMVTLVRQLQKNAGMREQSDFEILSGILSGTLKPEDLLPPEQPIVFRNNHTVSKTDQNIDDWFDFADAMHEKESAQEKGNSESASKSTGTGTKKSSASAPGSTAARKEKSSAEASKSTAAGKEKDSAASPKNFPSPEGRYEQMVLPGIQIPDPPARRQAVSKSNSQPEDYRIDVIWSDKTVQTLMSGQPDKTLSDFCKYCAIDKKKWSGNVSKKNKAALVIDALRQYPDCLHFIFYREEYEWLRQNCLSPGVNLPLPEAAAVVGKMLNLGFAEIHFWMEGSTEIAEIAVASDLESVLPAANGKQLKKIHTAIDQNNTSLTALMALYGIVEIEKFFEMYPHSFKVCRDVDDFRRYIYWHRRYNNTLFTVSDSNGKNYMAHPLVDAPAAMRQYMKHPELSCRRFSDEEIKDIIRGVCCYYMEWEFYYCELLDVTNHNVSETEARMTKTYKMVQAGASLDEIAACCLESLDYPKKPALADDVHIWLDAMQLSMETTLPLFHGHTRTEMLMQHEYDVDALALFSDKKRKKPTKSTRIMDFDPELQLILYYLYLNEEGTPDQYDKFLKEIGCANYQVRYLQILELIDDEQFDRATDEARALIAESRNDSLKDLLSEIQDYREMASADPDLYDDEEDGEDDAWDPEEDALFRKMFAGRSGFSLEGPPPDKIASVPNTPYRREQPKIGRNDPCPCGSGKKYKQCCGKNG